MPEELKNERLAKLEAKFDMFMDLLREIRDDVKNHPTQNDYENLKEDLKEAKKRIGSLEESRLKFAAKMAGSSAIIAMISAGLMRYALK